MDKANRKAAQEQLKEIGKLMGAAEKDYEKASDRLWTAKRKDTREKAMGEMLRAASTYQGLEAERDAVIAQMDAQNAA